MGCRGQELGEEILKYYISSNTPPPQNFWTFNFFLIFIILYMLYMPLFLVFLKYYCQHSFFRKVRESKNWFRELSTSTIYSAEAWYAMLWLTVYIHYHDCNSQKSYYFESEVIEVRSKHQMNLLRHSSAIDLDSSWGCWLGFFFHLSFLN